MEMAVRGQEPMIGPEHEREAERLLALARKQRESQRLWDHARTCGRTGLAPLQIVAPCAELIAEAQVHATLALIAETRTVRDQGVEQ